MKVKKEMEKEKNRKERKWEGKKKEKVSGRLNKEIMK